MVTQVNSKGEVCGLERKSDNGVKGWKLMLIEKRFNCCRNFKQDGCKLKGAQQWIISLD